QLLEGIGCAVRLEGPDFHLTKALAAELSLTTERLLGDHRVRAGGPCMNLVVHQVDEFQDVDLPDRDAGVERQAAPSVVEERLSGPVDQLGAVPGGGTVSENVA